MNKIKQIKNHINKWNGWRKISSDTKFYKILVLFKLENPPTFVFTWTDEELRNANER